MKKPDYGKVREAPAIMGNVPEKYPWLSEDRHCDVCVVGGGLTGAMCALEASRMELSTVLITSGAIGYGETGRLSGGAEYDCGSTLIGLDRTVGVDEALRLYSMGFEALDDVQNLCRSLDAEIGRTGLQSGFTRRDSLIMTSDLSELELMEREYAARRAKFTGCSFLTPKSADSPFAFEVRGGILTREGGASLDPYALTHLCLMRARQHGAEIFEQTGAADIQTPRNESGSVIIRTSTHRTVYTDRLIFATGSDGLESVGGRIRKYRTFTAVACPDRETALWPGSCLLRTPRDGGRHPVSLAIRPDGGIAASATVRFPPLPDIPFFSQKPDNTAVFRRLEKHISSALAQDEAVKAKYEYCRESVVPPDSLPVIGRHDGFKNCVFALTSAAGHFGDTGGPVFSRIAAGFAAKFLASSRTPNDPLFDPMRI